MTFTYRQMRVEDISAVLAVRQSTVENALTLEELEQYYGISPQSIADEMKSDTMGWLCEKQGNVIGFSMGNRSSGEVGVVAVMPEYEGNGIGKTLLTHVQNWLFSEGYKEIWLLANPDPDIRATGFYQELGWEATGVMEGHDQVLKLRKDRGCR